MILNERAIRHEHVVEVAKQMMVAARTAPKAQGADIVEVAVVTDEDIERISDMLIQMNAENGLKFFLRDAENIRHAEAIVLIGAHGHSRGLNCAYCGSLTCVEKPEATPCVMNSIDVGIAIGSACAMASDLRVDTRVMFSVGIAAQCLNLLDGCGSVFAIVISASSKNPFFDRKTD